jgi:hypothetical protein
VLFLKKKAEKRELKFEYENNSFETREVCVRLLVSVAK